MRSYRIRKELEAIMDTIGEDEEFTTAEIYARMSDFKNRPDRPGIARFLRKYAAITDYEYRHGRKVNKWTKRK